jgi:murein DD-endopeptidase MepM/ murein hydrolase activator NlpD
MSDLISSALRFRPSTRPQRGASLLRSDVISPARPWRWPLERLADREPVVLAEHFSGDRLGIDLGYAPRDLDTMLYVPVYSAQNGEVALAGESESGFIVTLDHGPRQWSTHYAHLSRLFVAPYLSQKSRRRQRVRSGECIGYAAKSPIHVRFELWNWTDERGFVPVDPIATMTSWGLPAIDVANGDRKAA